MKAVIKWTLWQRRWSTLWWSVGASLIIFVSIISYPSFKDQAAELQKSFEELPDAAVQLFGGSTDFFSPVGFLNSQVFFITLPLVLGALGIALGSSLLAREEQDKTIESILSRPISRSSLLFAKLIAGFLILGLVTLLCLLVTLATAKAVDIDVPSSSIAIATLICGLLALSWYCVAFLLTSIGRARGASIGIASAFAFGGYVISSLAGTVEWLKWPSKIFSFEYYKSEQILRDTYNEANLLFFVIIIVVCMILSWLAFRKRDIY